ncbi:MAG TPA: hypothetical protein VLA89_03290, partial [Gemmatimonadales bacterium]|nr:hypothetical protein [Gemmatimonadales bacterium]
MKHRKDRKAEEEVFHPGDIRVAPLVPTRDSPDHEMRESLEMMCRAATAQGIKVYNPRFGRASAVHHNRNALITDLLKSRMPFSHVFFVDDDMICPPDTIPRLLAHKKDIVAGLCTCRVDPPLPNARMWNEETQRWEELFQWQDGLVEVGGVGTACMLISLY